MSFDADLSWKLYRASLKHGDPTKVAEELGLPQAVLKQLMAEEPVLQRAADAAQADRLPSYSDDLSEESKAIWITLSTPATDDVKQAALIALANNGERERKKLVAYGLLHSNFDVTTTCRHLKVSIREFEKWAKTDPEFAEMLAETQAAKKHFVEGRLMGLVSAGSEKAVMFAAERLMKDTYGKILQVEGNVTHTHSTIDLGKLPIAIKSRIFELLEEANVISPDGLISYDLVAEDVKRLN